MLNRSRPGLLSRLPLQAGRRLGWGLVDQAVSSVTNFAISLYVARSLGAVAFGAFSLAYVTYTFALSASRGLATDPLMVRFSAAELPAWRRAVASCTGTAAAVGLVTGACCVGASALLSGTPRGAFLALGLTLPGLMLQDSWRYAFFALGRGGQAFINDLIWAAALVPALLFLRMTGRENVFSFVLVWGAAAAVAAAAGPLQARVLPRIWRTRAWVWQHRDLGLRYLAENTASSGTSQLRIYGVGLIVGLAAVGYVQAASTLMGPFLVIFMGISLVAVPEAGRILRRSPRHLRLFCLLVGGGLAVAALAWGAALLVMLPLGVGNWLLGPIWRPAYGLIPPLTVALMGACLSAGATAGLHALGAARRSLRAMVIASAAYLVGGLVGAYYWGALGTVCGVAVATCLGTLLWWWQLRAALRESAGAPALDGRPAPRPGPRHRKTSLDVRRPSAARPRQRRQWDERIRLRDQADAPTQVLPLAVMLRPYQDCLPLRPENQRSSGRPQPKEKG